MPDKLSGFHNNNLKTAIRPGLFLSPEVKRWRKVSAQALFWFPVWLPLLVLVTLCLLGVTDLPRLVMMTVMSVTSLSSCCIIPCQHFRQQTFTPNLSFPRPTSSCCCSLVTPGTVVSVLLPFWGPGWSGAPASPLMWVSLQRIHR